MLAGIRWNWKKSMAQRFGTECKLSESWMQGFIVLLKWWKNMIDFKKDFKRIEVEII